MGDAALQSQLFPIRYERFYRRAHKSIVAKQGLNLLPSFNETAISQVHLLFVTRILQSIDHIMKKRCTPFVYNGLCPFPLKFALICSVLGDPRCIIYFLLLYLLRWDSITVNDSSCVGSFRVHDQWKGVTKDAFID